MGRRHNAFDAVFDDEPRDLAYQVKFIGPGPQMGFCQYAIWIGPRRPLRSPSVPTNNREFSDVRVKDQLSAVLPEDVDQVLLPLKRSRVPDER